MTERKELIEKFRKSINETIQFKKENNTSLFDESLVVMKECVKIMEKESQSSKT